jgi:hypothetical protein
VTERIATRRVPVERGPQRPAPGRTGAVPRIEPAVAAAYDFSRLRIAAGPPSPQSVLRRQPAKQDPALAGRGRAAADALMNAADRLTDALDKGYLFEFESLTPAGDVYDSIGERREPQAWRATRLRRLVADLLELVNMLDAGQVPPDWFDPDVVVPLPGGTHASFGAGGKSQVWVDASALYLHQQFARDPSMLAMTLATFNPYYIRTEPLPKPVLKPPREEAAEEPRSTTPGTPTGIYLHVPDPQRAPLVYRRVTGYEGWQPGGVVVEVRFDEYGYFYWGRGDRKVRLPEEL